MVNKATGRPTSRAASLFTATIGVFGVGHHSYWPQFEGLLDEMKRKLARFVNKVRAHGGNVIDFGIADDARSAYALRSQLKAASLDLIFCDMLTYATSAAFGVIIRDLDVPIVSGGPAAPEGAWIIRRLPLTCSSRMTTSARCRSSQVSPYAWENARRR